MNIPPPPFKWNKLHAITQESKYSCRNPFLKQGTNPKDVPFWSNKRSEKGTLEHILSQFRTALLNPSYVLNLVWLVQMANFGLSEHQQILEKICRICGVWLKKAKDKYENSVLCTDKMEIIFTAFSVKVCKDDLDMCPPKFCNKCYKLALRGGIHLAINVWSPRKCTGNCKICSFFKDQRKPGRKMKIKLGIKPREDLARPKEQVEMVEGMSGTLSFQPDPASLSFSEEVKNLQSFRGSEPLYPEQFVENIKHEYMCQFAKRYLINQSRQNAGLHTYFC